MTLLAEDSMTITLTGGGLAALVIVVAIIAFSAVLVLTK